MHLKKTNDFHFDNVFYDSYSEVVNNYPNIAEVWEDRKVVSLYDTGPEFGLFANSDIIIMYDPETEEPMLITERIFRKNYNLRKWRAIKKRLDLQVETTGDTLQFGKVLRVATTFRYIDMTYIDESWLDDLGRKDI